MLMRIYTEQGFQDMTSYLADDKHHFRRLQETRVKERSYSDINRWNHLYDD